MALDSKLIAADKFKAVAIACNLSISTKAEKLSGILFINLPFYLFVIRSIWVMLYFCYKILQYFKFKKIFLNGLKIAHRKYKRLKVKAMNLRSKRSLYENL